MSPQLDEVCKKYGYKTVNVATWRDPSLSVLSGGRGPRSGYMVSPSDVSKPFIPRYKVKYPVPEPTDDEDSGDDMKEETHAKVDSPLEPPADDVAADEPDEDGEAQAEQNLEDDAPESAPETEKTQDQDPGAAENTERDRSEDVQPAADDVVTTELAEAPRASEDPVEPSATDDVELAPETVVDLVAESAADVDGSGASDEPPVPSGEAEGPPDGDAPPPADDDHGEDKKVTFAPGTPEPKPTVRKKKGAKGSKSKKKRSAVPVSDLPPDVQALIDGALDDIPPPPLDPPIAADLEQEDTHTAPAENVSATETQAAEEADFSAASSEGTDVEHEAPTHGDEAADEPSQQDMDGDVDNGSISDPITAPSENKEPTNPEPTESISSGDVLPREEDIAIDIVPPPHPSKEAVSKKHGSKKSSKKKGSKSKSKDIPRVLSGLGIDFAEEPLAPASDNAIDVVDAANVDDKTEAPAGPPPAADATGQPDLGPEEDSGANEAAAYVADPTADSEEPKASTVEAKAAAESDRPLEYNVSPDPEPAIEDDVPGVALNDENLEQAAVDDVSSPADSGIAMEGEEGKEDPVLDEGIDDTDIQVVEGEGADADADVDGDSKHIGNEPLEDDGAADTVASEQDAAGSIAQDEEPAAVDEDEAADHLNDAEHDVDETDAGPCDDGVERDASDLEHTEDGDEHLPGDAEASLADILAALDEPSTETADPPAYGGDEATQAAPGDHANAVKDAADANGDEIDSPVRTTTDSRPAKDAAVEEKDAPAAADAGTASVQEAAPAETLPTAEDTEEAPVTEDSADQVPALSPEEEATDNVEVSPAVEPPAAEDTGEALITEGPVDQASALEDKAVESVVDADPVVELSADTSNPDERPPEAETANPNPVEAEPSSDAPAPDVQDDSIAPDEQPAAPPSPVLSKTSSHASHKSTHWDRPHKANPLKEVFEAPVALKRPHGHRTGSKDEVVHRGERKHRRHRSKEEDKERREKRRLEKNRQEAARAFEEERRRARHEARRAARKAAEEEVAKIAREEARKAAEKDAERRRRRRHETDLRDLDRRERELQDELRERKAKDREWERRHDERSAREPKTSTSTTSRPPISKVFSGESVHRTGFFVAVGGGGGEERPTSRHSKEAPRSPRLERSKTSPASVAAAASESAAGTSSKGSHRSRRRTTEQDGEGEERSSHRSSRHGGSGEHRRRRPTTDQREKPNSFLGSLFKRS